MKYEYGPGTGVPECPQKKREMYIECVITCFRYGDFLAHTLPLNLLQFDRIIVVTSPEDELTRRVCQMWGIHGDDLVLTDAARTRWAEFCKGKAINAGLAVAEKRNWVCHMDADIALPAHSRYNIEIAQLDPTMIYGLDRIEFKSWAAWQRYLGDPEPQREAFVVHTAATFEHAPRIGSRVVLNHLGGYLPIGFFQLWNAASGVNKYFEGHTDAGREDTNFAAQWPRAKRGFIPEVIAWHLESEALPMGVNWKRRVSARFHVDGGDVR